MKEFYGINKVRINSETVTSMVETWLNEGRIAGPHLELLKLKHLPGNEMEIEFRVKVKEKKPSGGVQ